MRAWSTSRTDNTRLPANLKLFPTRRVRCCCTLLMFLSFLQPLHVCFLQSFQLDELITQVPHLQLEGDQGLHGVSSCGGLILPIDNGKLVNRRLRLG